MASEPSPEPEPEPEPAPATTPLAADRPIARRQSPFRRGLAVIVTLGLIGGLLWYGIAAHSRNQTLVSENTRLTGLAGSLRQENSSLSQNNTDLQSENNRLQAEVTNLRSFSAHPSLLIWTDCGGPCSMRGEPYYRAGGVPDTFDYIIHFTATVPITTYILTLQQFAQFDQCGISCVHGTYTSWSARTSLDTTFTGAEGCASYIAVFVAQGTGVMTPKISVKYNPADHLTGACVRSG